MCCQRNGGSASNDTDALSCTTHCAAAAITSSARLRAYSSPASRPAATSATTMTTASTIDRGSRNRSLALPSCDESFCGGGAWGGACGGAGWPADAPGGNCGGRGGTGGTWLAGRAQGSVT